MNKHIRVNIHVSKISLRELCEYLQVGIHICLNELKDFKVKYQEMNSYYSCIFFLQWLFHIKLNVFFHCLYIKDIF